MLGCTERGDDAGRDVNFTLFSFTGLACENPHAPELTPHVRVILPYTVFSVRGVRSEVGFHLADIKVVQS